MVNLSTLKVVAFATWAYMATASPVRHPDNPEITLWGIKFTSTVIYSSPSHMAVATGTIDFTVENSLLSYTLSCQAYASRYPEIFYGEIPYECEAPADSLGGGTFTFSRPDGAITLNQTWVDEEYVPRSYLVTTKQSEADF
jgi:hypothetical protein